MEGLDSIIGKHPFFQDMPETARQLVAGCARNVRFNAEEYLFREGESADRFYLLRHGRVSLELTAPGRGSLRFQTLPEGEIVGVSWLIPPWRWTYDARALDLVRAVAIDAACLRYKCEVDHDLGYDMMKRFMSVLIKRLHEAELQLLDLYGNHD